MKLNIKMPAQLKKYYKIELTKAKIAIKDSDNELVWLHLERAHILGQRYPYQHTQTHWLMLCQGIKSKNVKEIFGQLVRLLLGAPFSFINKIPVGNVGSTRVSMIKQQAIPKDIADTFSQLEI